MKPQGLLYFAVSIVLLLVFPAGAAAQVRPSNQSARPLFSNIKIESTRNLVFVRTRLNNSRPLWFILDSGASLSVVNEKHARSLGLKLGHKSEINAIGGMIEYRLVKGVNFDVSGATLSNQTIAAIDLSVLEPKLGRNIHGILGGEFFSRYVVEIDYVAETLNLYDPAAFRYSGTGEVIPFEIESNTPFIRADLSASGSDFVRGSFLVDTGAMSPLYINNRFEEKHGLLHSLGKTIPDLFTTHLGGEITGRVGRIKKIRLGTFTLRDAIVHFPEQRSRANGSSSTTRDGIIGGGFLRKFTVILDYRRKQMILTPNETLHAPFEFDQSGLELIAVGVDFKTIKVRKVLDDSPASEAGLRVGDILLYIGGKAANELSLDATEKMLSQCGVEYDVTVSREGEPLKTRIKLCH